MASIIVPSTPGNKRFTSPARTLVVVPLLLLIHGQGGAQSPGHTAARQGLDPVLAGIDSIARSAVAELPLAGLSIAVARGPRLLLARGYGHADLEHDVPATEHTVYRIASITKQFTAAAILKLAEEGKLRLDDDITRHLPSYPTQGRRITLRQLLNHTSGIRSFTELPAFAPRQRLDLSDDDMLAIFQDEPLDFEPGTNFLYNNSGYYLLAMVVEAVTGRRYDDYLGEAVLAPLGLGATRGCDDRPLIERRARGYVAAEGSFRNAGYISMYPPKGGGSLCSTVLDLVQWVQAQATGLGLRPDSYRQMQTPAKLASGEEIAYGLGLLLSRFEGHEEVLHGGGINGFSSYLAYFPADSLTVVVLSNTAASLWDGVLARRLAQPLLAYYGKAAPSGEAARTRLGGERTQTGGERAKASGASQGARAAGEIDRYTGEYSLGSIKLTASREGDLLFLESGGAQQLDDRVAYESRGGGRFVAVADPELELGFEADANGAVRLTITLAGRFYGRAVRSP